ncbi:MAG TPA: TIGR03088 family PEP-CTERM/XrtA system glycosyltransferase [Steroidobacteraceae bacterium]|nr:TIGR03088 family PEP-CTERM/XrtA system glycosyltransferase [Steroidobacteraceae bacterium]
MAAPLIAHIIFRLDYGGLENGLVNLLNRMPAEEFRHVIVCLAGFTEFRRRIERSDIAVYSLDKKPGKDFGAYARCWKLLRQLHPDIVHTRNLGTVDMQWIAFAAGIRDRVHGEHGWDASDAQGLNAKNLRIRRACRPLIKRYATVSKDLANWLRNQVGVRAEAIEQIYNGVDTQKFSPEGALPSDLPWTQAARPFIFGTVGRFDPIKNHLGLIDAFAKVSQSSRLVIIGDGAMAPQLRERVDRLQLQDKIWMPGARNDIAAFMRTFDVFVLPSLNEGISNTILEAMASGKPVIAGNVGGNVELIEPNRTGKLYDVSAPDGLEKALREYLADPSLAKVHGIAARERAIERFSMDAMVNGYRSLYRNVLAHERN